MPKLIESDFPFAELSRVAERESWRKEVYRPVYYLHKWWARRLGSVFRGIVLGACLDESDDFWQQFYGKNDFADTVLFDPFMGSGVTVGEALKLGCRAVGRDINQVAYLANRAAFSRYSASEVLSTYAQLERSVAPKLLSYFETTTVAGGSGTVLYFFLVKVVKCPKCSYEIDLFKTRIFSRNAVPKKDPSARSVCPGCGEINSTRFDAETVWCDGCGLRYDPQIGNVRGATVTCNHCQHAFRLVDRMKELNGPLGFRRYAKLVLAGDGKKVYETLNETDRELERRVAREFASIADTLPEVAVLPGYNTDQMIKHNYEYWHQLFSDRQLVCINHLATAIRHIEQEDLRLLFGCLFSGVLEFNNLFTSFKGEGTGAVRHMFAHHVLRPEMMPLEANLWGTSKSSGGFSGMFHSRVERMLAYKSDPFELRLNGAKSAKVHRINAPLAHEIVDDFAAFQAQPDSVYLSTGDSACTDLVDESVDLVVTDPPFFDNVHYSQLADFFYYWLNQVLLVSDSPTTRAANEVQDTNSESFTKKLTSVFSECRRVLRPDGLFIFTYHHSRHEGWTSVHRAIRHAGFTCIQSYPIKAEMSVSMPLQQAKSPIHIDLILVCRRDSESHGEVQASANLAKAIKLAEEQVASLKGNGIKVSLGDAKVILMGRLLCETHRIRNLELEERWLEEIEDEIDGIAGNILATKGEVLYESFAEESIQLMLFEKIEKYVANKGMQTDG